MICKPFSICIRHIMQERDEKFRPIGPGFSFSPARWRLPLVNQRNNGVLEKWPIGYLKQILSLKIYFQLNVLAGL